ENFNHCRGRDRVHIPFNPIVPISLVVRMSKTIFFTLALLFGFCAVPRAADNVVISEFMARNANTLADEDGDFPDWIELHNAGSATVNLDGWYLTDDPIPLTKWRIPATNLVANGYLVIFASGKNRAVPGAQLHTSFQLNGDGEYLALVRPDLSIATEFAPVFP